MKHEPVVLDSSAWIEYVQNGPNADEYARVFKGKNVEIIVPSVCIFEVYRSIERIVSMREALAVTMGMQAYVIDELSSDRARQAAAISRAHSLSTADAIIYATAQAFSATLYTQDADFIKLPGVKYFKHRR
jgi:predicted nucleic acid-binding protein